MRGYFGAGSGNMTDEVIVKVYRTARARISDENFRIEEEEKALAYVKQPPPSGGSKLIKEVRF